MKFGKSDERSNQFKPFDGPHFASGEIGALQRTDVLLRVVLG